MTSVRPLPQDYLHFADQGVVQSEVPRLQEHVWRCRIGDGRRSSRSESLLPYNDNGDIEVVE